MIALRPYLPSDRVPVGDLFADPEVMQFVGNGQPMLFEDGPHIVDRILEKYRVDLSFHVWVVEEDGGYVGHAELKRREGRPEYELIYLLERRHWNRGLGGTVA